MSAFFPCWSEQDTVSQRQLTRSPETGIVAIFCGGCEAAITTSCSDGNVPEMGLGANAIILRQVISALEAAGYDVHTRMLSAWQFGVPQRRQRLILVGVRNKVKFHWPRRFRDTAVTVRDAISDLSEVKAGSKTFVVPYAGARNSFQRWCRRGVLNCSKRKLYDHIARAVRPDDLEAFRLMQHNTLYSDLPKHLRRYRADIFDDKYKRLPWDDMSRTITAHISKDGYWYIHRASKN